ncbi:hypothetical protein NDU88_005218 [Pleurodeles waltl]|uniref:Uncharacterized protein n=1 Tax=Pleurodeles waltl TaxID=8319 RepID=A0AAV7TA67_PLEWA|nr:hypothetical protein NDU88_005218 [Pleurodeles waltl]
MCSPWERHPGCAAGHKPRSPGPSQEHAILVNSNLEQRPPHQSQTCAGLTTHCTLLSAAPPGLAVHSSVTAPPPDTGRSVPATISMRAVPVPPLALLLHQLLPPRVSECRPTFYTDVELRGWLNKCMRRVRARP